ncbi:MAG: ATP-binding cassette domain-containing protein [Clostridia bacterium]|nr:ATP-binding cassette domain-containing protein [Clostridia bacterium]
MGLKIANVSKVYGQKKVVDNISFEINSPGVFGLLGTNGAGKTTTIRMLLGILKKTEGEITWRGKEVTRKNVNFGYLPEERGIYPKSKIYDQLTYFAELKGMKRQEANEKVKYWTQKLKIEEYINLPAEKLSKGNQQKVQFITAVMHNPELIILDEPFSGLDPVNTQIIKEVILELVAEGKYIVMSSHQMTSIEEFCKDVVIINKGKTVLKGNLQEIKDNYECNGLQINSKTNIEEYIKEIGLEIKFSKNNEYDIKIQGEEKAYELFNLLAKNNIKINKFEVKKPSLQEIFIQKVGETQ